MDEYPSNSRKSRVDEPPPKKVEKIIEGEVVRRKKPLSRRFMETFFGGGDAGTVWSYILSDVLVPAAKDMVSDAVSQGVERTLFGETNRRRQQNPTRGLTQYTSYNRYSASPGLRRPEDPRQGLSRRGRETHDFNEIIIGTKVEAEEVIDALFEIISKYESVTVANLYELIGETGTFTDEKWGWTDLRAAGVTRVKSGYLLDLPRPEPLN